MFKFGDKLTHGSWQYEVVSTDKNTFDVKVTAGPSFVGTVERYYNTDSHIFTPVSSAPVKPELTTNRLARALFETDDRIVELVSKVGEFGKTPEYAQRTQRILDTAWARNEFGARTDARHRARLTMLSLEIIP